MEASWSKVLLFTFSVRYNSLFHLSRNVVLCSDKEWYGQFMHLFFQNNLHCYTFIFLPKKNHPNNLIDRHFCWTRNHRNYDLFNPKNSCPIQFFPTFPSSISIVGFVFIGTKCFMLQRWMVAGSCGARRRCNYCDGNKARNIVSSAILSQSTRNMFGAQLNQST